MKLFQHLAQIQEANKVKDEPLAPKLDSTPTNNLVFVFKKVNDAFTLTTSDDVAKVKEVHAMYAKLGSKIPSRGDVFTFDGTNPKLLKHLGITAGAKEEEIAGTTFITRLKAAGFTSAGKYLHRKIYKRGTMLFLIDDTEAAAPPVFFAKQVKSVTEMTHPYDVDDFSGSPHAIAHGNLSDRLEHVINQLRSSCQCHSCESLFDELDLIADEI